MARSREAGSRMSPSTSSRSSPARLPRGLSGRTRARTRWPAAMSARATAEPTKPLAPVTRVGSLDSMGHDIDLGTSFAPAPHRDDHGKSEAWAITLGAGGLAGGMSLDQPTRQS